jgi:MFS family permease
MVERKTTGLFSLGILSMIITHSLVHAAGNLRPTLYPILMDEFQLTNLQIGIIAAVPPLTQAVFSIPAGWVSDRFGAKNIIIASLVMAGTGALLAGVASNAWVYILASVFLTLTSTFYHPPSHVYCANAVPRQDRAKAMGMLNAGGTFGISLGPLSVTVLMGALFFTWRQLYLFWVPAIVLGIILMLVVKTDRYVNEENGGSHNNHVEESDPDEVESLLTREFITYISSRGVRMFAGSMLSAFMSIYLSTERGFTISQLGLMFGIGGVLGLVISPIGGFMATRFGEKKWVLLSQGLGTAFLSGAFFTTGVYPFIVMYLAYRFCGIISMPALAAITARLSPPGQMGMGFALSFMPSAITGIVGPVFAAWIADTYGYFPIFMVAGVVSYLGLGVFSLAVKD